jgi:hypothetical protein
MVAEARHGHRTPLLLGPVGAPARGGSSKGRCVPDADTQQIRVRMFDVEDHVHRRRITLT